MESKNQEAVYYALLQLFMSLSFKQFRPQGLGIYTPYIWDDLLHCPLRKVDLI